MCRICSGKLPRLVSSRFLVPAKEVKYGKNKRKYPASGGNLSSQYLKSADYNPKRIAVERNGEIIPKSKYEETLLSDGDVLEIVSFVGGG